MNSENTTTSMKYSNCKKEKTIDFFRLKKGSTADYYKTCVVCLDKNKIRRAKNKQRLSYVSSRYHCLNFNLI